LKSESESDEALRLDVLRVLAAGLALSLDFEDDDDDPTADGSGLKADLLTGLRVEVDPVVPFDDFGLT
jgi:hypothetical protein